MENKRRIIKTHENDKEKRKLNVQQYIPMPDFD